MYKTRFILTDQQTKRIKDSEIVRGESVSLQMVKAAQARLVGNRTRASLFGFFLLNCSIFLVRIELSSCLINVKIFNKIILIS